VESSLDDPLWEGNGGDDGATPLSPEDREHLIPTHITLRSELNEFEARGVSKAEGWGFARRRSTAVLLDPKFIRNLHRHMLGEVWKWAGTYRTLGANVGVDPGIIQVELRKLLDDARYWLDHATYSPDEIAVRFHHRLVAIHPFPNGNGRISRLMADLLIVAQGGARFTWGRSRGGDENRTRYLAALRAADLGDCAPLVVFARLP